MPAALPIRRRPRTVAPILAAALVVAPVVVLGACAQESSTTELGSGSGSPGEAPPVPDDVEAAFDDAIAATRSISSAEVTFDLGVESPMASYRAVLDGVFDRDDAGTMTATIEGEGQPSDIELRSDGEMVWIRADDPAIASELPEGKAWVEASVDELREAGVFSGLDTTFDTVPVLRGIDEVDDAGAGEVGGDPVRLLEGEVDWQAALDAADGDEREGLEGSVTVGNDTDITEFTATIGLDGEGRVRRLVLDVTAGPAAGQRDDAFDERGEITLHLAFDIDRVDHDVEVPDAPPADETVRLSEVPAVEQALIEGL
jgi:hypothetical protein